MLIISICVCYNMNVYIYLIVILNTCYVVMNSSFIWPLCCCFLVVASLWVLWLHCLYIPHAHWYMLICNSDSLLSNLNSADPVIHVRMLTHLQLPPSTALSTLSDMWSEMWPDLLMVSWGYLWHCLLSQQNRFWLLPPERDLWRNDILCQCASISNA